MCAQHAINALLQGEFFTPMALAEIARELDAEERKRMAEGGIESAECVIHRRRLLFSKSSAPACLSPLRLLAVASPLFLVCRWPS
jgi:hypothetical protein